MTTFSIFESVAANPVECFVLLMVVAVFARSGLRWWMSLAAAPCQLFCDLDGVLCDFDKKVQEACGKPPDQLHPIDMWRALEGVDGGRPTGFFDQLEWTEDGQRLWTAIRHLHPVILTGLPQGTWAAPQKRKWCARELGCATKVITCKALQKCKYCRTGSLLIDDNLDLQQAWEKAGGIFIHHTTTARTLRKLQALRVLGHSNGTTALHAPAGEGSVPGADGSQQRRRKMRR